MQCPEFGPQYNKIIKNKRSQQKANPQLLIKKKRKKDIISLCKSQHWNARVRTQATLYTKLQFTCSQTTPFLSQGYKVPS